MVDADVIVVGAGPVGMLAALLAAHQGLDVLVLERDANRHTQSRAIGITPPSLEILQHIGLCSSFIANGIAVRSIRIHYGPQLLWIIDFNRIDGTHPYVLAIPQHSTEDILERALLHTPSIRLLRGHAVQDVSSLGNGVAAYGGYGQQGRFHFTCHCLLGCDGGRSATREALGISFRGRADHHTFLMGDFEDSGTWGEDACFFFTPRGSVEAFPLPHGHRRYVLRTPTYIPAFTSDFMRKELLARAGIEVAHVHQAWESSFGVQRYLAERFSRDNVFLCGDAAHLMSPIGGQNMNIGFADAEMACWLARLVIEKSVTPERASSLYNRVRTLAARTALRRAHCMMLAGTSGGHAWSALRTVALGAVVQTPLSKLLLRQLTMHSIPFRNLDHYRSEFEAKLRLS